MKKEIAQKWINALRSGEYKQTKDKLKDENGFCCLGVLDDILPDLDLSNGDDQVLYNFSKVGLDSPDGLLPYFGDDGVLLSALNDFGAKDAGPLNFDEIADIIQIVYVEEAQ